MAAAVCDAERWGDLRRYCWRDPGVCDENWSEDLKGLDWGDLKILVIGAGGLGCEILKDLALSGFRSIDVIDMDTVDLSNLNRQFLFRETDVGKPKATVAAKFVMDRVPGCTITPHFGRIEDKPDSFYREFACIVLGLDSVHARMWINDTVCRLTEWTTEDGCGAQVAATIPLVDGGTEGFKGHARVVNIGQTACIASTAWMFPPQVTFPMCTIESVPRLPEHCVEYIKVKTWEDEAPFGKLPNGRPVPVDGDNPDHILWIAEKAQLRARQHNIDGVTYAFAQGVVKNITPAIASTNAIIAAACCNEVLKMATGASPALKNYFMYNGNSIDLGVYGQVQDFPPDPTCEVSQPPQVMKVSRQLSVREFVQRHLLGNANVANDAGQLYSSAEHLTLQSHTAGVLMAPAGTLVANDGSAPLSKHFADDERAMVLASDRSFWGGNQLKLLLVFE